MVKLALGVKRATAQGGLCTARKFYLFIGRCVRIGVYDLRVHNRSAL